MPGAGKVRATSHHTMHLHSGRKTQMDGIGTSKGHTPAGSHPPVLVSTAACRRSRSIPCLPPLLLPLLPARVIQVHVHVLFKAAPLPAATRLLAESMAWSERRVSVCVGWVGGRWMKESEVGWRGVVWCGVVWCGVWRGVAGCGGVGCGGMVVLRNSHPPARSPAPVFVAHRPPPQAGPPPPPPLPWPPRPPLLPLRARSGPSAAAQAHSRGPRGWGVACGTASPAPPCPPPRSHPARCCGSTPAGNALGGQEGGGGGGGSTVRKVQAGSH